MASPADQHVDAVVVGAGFGGLGAALQLAEAGLRVVVCEALNYPGGCAGTFTRQGGRFDAGATLALGLGEGEAMQHVLARYGLQVRRTRLDPVIEVRTPGWATALQAGPEGLARTLRQVAEEDGAPAEGVDGFVREVDQTVRAVGPILRDPALVPPPTLTALARHAARLPAYLPLLRQVGLPVSARLRWHGLADAQGLRRLLEPLCWLTVQTGLDEAEAPFALGAIDALSRGAYHVSGGLGALADALVEAIGRAGGEVRLSTRVRGLAREGRSWRIDTRRGVLRAPLVLANVLPQGLPDLLGQPVPRLDRRARAVATGWGAAMQYLLVDADALPPEAHHLDLCADPSRPYRDGNHVFCSVSAAGEDRGPAGLRAVVASTHVTMPASADTMRQVHDTMAHTLQTLAPALWAARQGGHRAGPATFERFTRRSQGFVGGIPRRAGLAQYLRLVPQRALPGLYLVGDSTLLGQSTLAAFLSGVRVAAFVTGAPITAGRPGPARPTPERRDHPASASASNAHAASAPDWGESAGT